MQFHQLSKNKKNDKKIFNIVNGMEIINAA